MQEALGFAVIGCGEVSQLHREQIRQLADARLVAVSDISAEKAKAVGKREQVDWYADYHEMVQRDDIDVVNILTPSATHADAMVAAARAGKHVIVEKPIDVTVTRAEQAIAACREAGVKLCVISQHRFDRSTMRVKQEVDRGHFGQLFLAQASVHWFRGPSYFDTVPGRGTWAMDGGGVLMIQALHTIDIMQDLLGPVESVFARTAIATHPHIEVEDVAVATLAFESGALGTITATTGAFPGLSTRLEIFGEDGSAMIEDDRLRKLYLRPHRDPGEMFGASADNVAPDEDAVDFGNAHRRQLADMLDAIRHDREPKVNGEESLKVLKLILALYESAQTGKSVTLDH